MDDKVWSWLEEAHEGLLDEKDSGMEDLTMEFKRVKSLREEQERAEQLKKTNEAIQKALQVQSKAGTAAQKAAEKGAPAATAPTPAPAPAPVAAAPTPTPAPTPAPAAAAPTPAITHARTK